MRVPVGKGSYCSHATSLRIKPHGPPRQILQGGHANQRDSFLRHSSAGYRDNSELACSEKPRVYVARFPILESGAVTKFRTTNQPGT